MYQDTAGEERYGRLTSFYCRGASGVIVAYDITSKKSFATLKERFVPLLEDADSHRLVAVVGTKLDLLGTQVREVSQDDGKNLAIHLNQNWQGKKLQQVPFFESSSKDGINIKEVFEFLLSNLLPLDETAKPNSPVSDTPKSSNNVDTIKLGNERPSDSQNQRKRGSCCS